MRENEREREREREREFVNGQCDSVKSYHMLNNIRLRIRLL